jgi:hypothetical protein
LNIITKKPEIVTKRRPVRQYLYESVEVKMYNSSVMALVELAITVTTICSVVSTELPTVTVQQGTLQGTNFKTVWGKEYLAFLGIPYAKPPVGDLRFRVSYNSSSWSIHALSVKFTKDNSVLRFLNLCLQILSPLGYERNVVGRFSCPDHLKNYVCYEEGQFLLGYRIKDTF